MSIMMESPMADTGPATGLGETATTGGTARTVAGGGWVAGVAVAGDVTGPVVGRGAAVVGMVVIGRTAVGRGAPKVDPGVRTVIGGSRAEEGDPPDRSSTMAATSPTDTTRRATPMILFLLD
jgi:hypothetical protein